MSRCYWMASRMGLNVAAHSRRQFGVGTVLGVEHDAGGDADLGAVPVREVEWVGEYGVDPLGRGRDEHVRAI